MAAAAAAVAARSSGSLQAPASTPTDGAPPSGGVEEPVVVSMWGGAAGGLFGGGQHSDSGDSDGDGGGGEEGDGMVDIDALLASGESAGYDEIPGAIEVLNAAATPPAAGAALTALMSFNAVDLCDCTAWGDLLGGIFHAGAIVVASDEHAHSTALVRVLASLGTAACGASAQQAGEVAAMALDLLLVWGRATSAASVTLPGVLLARAACYLLERLPATTSLPHVPGATQDRIIVALAACLCHDAVAGVLAHASFVVGTPQPAIPGWLAAWCCGSAQRLIWEGCAATTGLHAALAGGVVSCVAAAAAGGGGLPTAALRCAALACLPPSPPLPSSTESRGTLCWSSAHVAVGGFDRAAPGDALATLNGLRRVFVFDTAPPGGSGGGGGGGSDGGGGDDGEWVHCAWCTPLAGVLLPRLVPSAEGDYLLDPVASRCAARTALDSIAAGASREVRTAALWTAAVAWLG